MFKDAPPHNLIIAIYPILSHDNEYNVFMQVNKGRKGENKGETIVIRGWPSFLVCTAKDDSNVKRWGETKSRFDNVSPNVSKTKYDQGIDLVFSKSGLPDFLFQESIISEKDEERKKELVLKLIKLIKSANNQIFNPFKDVLAEIFPHEVGYRFRQGSRFSTLVEIHCLCYSLQRPIMTINNQKIPLVALSDIGWANKIFQDNETIPPYKIKWYNEKFYPAWKSFAVPFKPTITQKTLEEPTIEGQEKGVIRIKNIVEFVKNQGGKTNARQVRETYLDILEEYGYVEKDIDPDNKTSYVFWPSKINTNDNHQSPLISLSPFNASRLRSCLEKYRIERFTLMCNNKKYDTETIIPILLCDQNSFRTPKIVRKNTEGD